MMEEEVQDRTETTTIEEVESTNDSEPTNDQNIEQCTSLSASLSQLSVSGSDDSSSTSAESEDSGSDPISSPAESDEESLDCLIDSASSDKTNTSQKFLALSILKAVRQKDKNSLLEVLKTCKENNFPQSRKITHTCWRALHLAISSQSHKECLESLLEYDNGVLISLNDKTARLIIRQKDVEENILFLLQKGYEFYVKSHRLSILHLAACSRRPEVLSCLLNHSVNINIKDPNGYTPLHYSALHGRLEETRILLENGADVLLANSDGDLPLHCILYGVHVDYRDIICLLVERDSTTINYPNNRGMTPFFCAVDYGMEASLISYLLEKGAHIVDADSGITAFQLAVSRNCNHLLPLLLEAIPFSHIIKYFLLDISSNMHVLNTDFEEPKNILSLTCSAIDTGTTCLANLINRHLPEAVLQAPSLLDEMQSYLVISPLAYLFRKFYAPRNEKFDPCLDMLLNNKITMLDEFRSVLLGAWPHNRGVYIHPLTEIFRHSVSLPEQLYYFNLLNANDVTIDYCLRCYHYNMSTPFAAFTGYCRYYEPVVNAAYRGDVEIVRLLISTSNIVEPDILSHCVLSSKLNGTDLSSLVIQDIRSVLEYLISLKPIYYKHKQHSFLSYSTASKRFSKVTLKGLCRTAIRAQLRERTLEENLLNFRRKILELPLPNLLKDYLLFKF